VGARPQYRALHVLAVDGLRLEIRDIDAVEQRTLIAIISVPSGFLPRENDAMPHSRQNR